MYIILVIEDDLEIRAALEQMALTAEITVTFVESALIAKGIADTAYMPDIHDAIIVGGYFQGARVQNGHEIVKRLRVKSRTVPIVGTAGDPQREKAFRSAGATDFIVRGAKNRPALGLLIALEILKTRDKKKNAKAKESPTPDRE